jgi:5'-nucleotidase
LITSAASYGRLLTKIDLTLDTSNHRIVSKHARNIPITRDVPPDVEVDRIVQDYEAKALGVTGRIIGYVKGDLTGNAKAAGSASCETPLGDVIADAMRASTDAEIAFMNPGGIRADLVARHPGRPDYAITYADAFEVQPFGNVLVTMSLSGAQIRTLLEGQFGDRHEPRILQVSRGFSYRYAYDRAHRRAVVSEPRLHGRLIEPTRTYRVTVPSFLAGGGDSFAVLKAGEERKDGAVDVDALATYLGKVGPAAAPLVAAKEARIEGDGCR